MTRERHRLWENALSCSERFKHAALRNIRCPRGEVGGGGGGEEKKRPGTAGETAVYILVSFKENVDTVVYFPFFI